jgi:hypothetical protein
MILRISDQAYSTSLMVRSALFLARVSNHEMAALILRDARKSVLLRMRTAPYNDRLTASGKIFRGLGAARCPAAV